MRPLPNLHRLSSRHARRGVTIPELLTVVVILALLMVAAFQGYGKFRQRAEMVDATTKLKNIHAALQNYVSTKHDWPHEPEEGSHEALWEWWMNEMKPYGLTTTDWFSSAHLRMVNQIRKDSGQSEATAADFGKIEELKIPSFYPAKFGDYDDAFESRYQPWVTESSEFHGDAGNLVVMPDGTVQKMPSLSVKRMARGN
jgi:prepilin-type N-terminal cleavage/methylation domain-containing protein